MPFQNEYANLVSQKSEAHTRLIRDYDGPNPDFDYIVIGSGIGGGTVADDLADRKPDKRILVVDVGSFVYPTHVYNISRIPNDKVANHFGADNFQQTGTGTHFIGGKPQLVFGGRSVFWSGLIPQPQDWELEFFPAAIRAALKNEFLKLAGERMNASLTLGSKAQELVAHFHNSSIGNDFDIYETPRALHQPYLLADGTPANKFFLEPTGVFNTAELLINQSGLTPGHDLNGSGLFIRLNSFVEAVNSVPHDWYEVKTTNTVTGEQRSFYSPKVVVAAGSTESPKLINRSSVFHTLPADIKSLVGFGLTDHPVSSESQAYVTSVGNPRIDISPQDHAKIIFYSKGNLDATGHVQYPFNIEMNVNHEYWHLRNNDPSAGLTPNDPTRTRVDIKFSFANCLDDQNGIHSHANDGYTPYISFKRFADLNDLLNSRFPAVAGWHKNAGDFLTLLNNTRDRIFAEFNDVEFQTAPYGELGNDQKPFGWGTVHHACGTLRMPWKANRDAAFNTRSVVDEDLRVHGTAGLYVCDMSVLPVSTAANPVRALAGLSLRLSRHLG
ncbi:choline dehydrogenase [Stieleria neptunia]|uniref:Choline dehydrogenase n=1 Tax=Stieleria neptunia TaxID=2527979 RepID=A0A518HN37_9BACT|nr:GMC oxidoreductase [Stieleria neptunia]QDV42229.1 choline dehydrogenase [Stieleria neptunia]